MREVQTHRRTSLRTSPATAAAQLAKQRDKQDEYDTGGAEMAIGAILVQTVRVDHAVGARQFRSGKMMIDDNHIHSGLRHLLERPVRGNSAIHRNNQPGAAFLQGGERRLVGAIALAHPIRDMHIDSQPQRANVIASGAETLSFELAPSEAGKALLLSLQNREVPNLEYRLSGELGTVDDPTLTFSGNGRIYPVPGRPGQFR